MLPKHLTFRISGDCNFESSWSWSYCPFQNLPETCCTVSWTYVQSSHVWGRGIKLQLFLLVLSGSSYHYGFNPWQSGAVRVSACWHHGQINVVYKVFLYISWDPLIQTTSHIDTAHPWFPSNPPGRCEVDLMNGSWNMWRTNIQTDRLTEIPCFI